MNRVIKTMLVTAAALIGTAVALPAAAQFAKPEAAIKYRQSVMTVQSYHLGRVFAMTNGKVPFDAKAVATDADVLLTVAQLPFVAFGEGTDKGDTKAQPKVWTDKDAFMAAARKMQDEVAKLNVAAKGGNLDAIKVAAGDVGKACKACHDNFRKE